MTIFGMDGKEIQPAPDKEEMQIVAIVINAYQRHNTHGYCTCKPCGEVRRTLLALGNAKIQQRD